MAYRKKHGRWGPNDWETATPARGSPQSLLDDPFQCAVISRVVSQTHGGGSEDHRIQAVWIANKVPKGLK